MAAAAVAVAAGVVGGGVGVGVGIGVGTILLNEAIRRSQERQAAEPRGCPPGLVPSRKGCVKPGKDKGHKGPDIANAIRQRSIARAKAA